MKSVSVVIPAFNEESGISKIIRNLQQQDYQYSFEIIIVDNASTDNTATIAKELGVKVIHEPQKGTRFAYDAGMKAAKGEILLVTNVDVKLPLNWISTLVSYYEDPEVVGVGTHVDYYNCSKSVNYVWYCLKYIGDVAVATKLFSVKERTFWGTSLSCTKEVFLKVGGINHGIDTNEDMLFTKLIREHGKAPYIYDVTVLMDGRRYDMNPFSAFINWFDGTGFNSIIIALFGKSLFSHFKDVRRSSKSKASIPNVD